MKKIKKILFVNSSLTGGGSERVMVLLANEFSKQGYDVTMALVREKEKETYFLNKNIKKIKFNYGTRNKLIIAVKRIIKLRKIIKKEQFGVVISFMYDINLTTLIAGQGLKIPIIISERADPSARKQSKIYKWIEYKYYKKAHKIVFQTEEVKKMYPQDLQKKSQVISNPVNSNLPKCYEGERRKNIASVGRMVEQKNFFMLIEAFAKFHNIYPDYKLSIYGEGTLLEALKEKVNELNISEMVVFPGYVKNVNEEIKDFSMYISTSNYEGISNSMIEALAMGIPTVCTDCPVGGARLMIKNKVNGILIPVGDVEALYNSMLELAENEELAKIISKNAIKIRESHSIENIVEQWKRILF